MPIIDIKQAAAIATAYFTKLMTPDDIRLEEVEISDDERFWYITLSGLVPAEKVPPPSLIEGQASLSTLAGFFKPEYERIYRVFKVDPTGSVRAMKIRRI